MANKPRFITYDHLLWGRHLEEWSRIAKVLDKHNIKDAEDLDFALTPITLGPEGRRAAKDN